MTHQRSSIDILEEAVNLLRSSPLETAVTYLVGAVPLTLAFLFFLADMNRSPYAFDHLPWASLALALLYVWKNSWQAIFMAKLFYQLSPSEAQPASPVQSVLIQASLQPLGLLIPLPFPWITAFFRNVALYAALGRADAISAARRQAVYATRQNWGVLLIVALGSLLLFANVLVTIVALPQLARSFLGIEGDLARLGSGIVNLTTLGVAAAITWLAIDPLLDAVYTLRCFYGESVATGGDLRASLKRLVSGNFPSVRMLTHGGSDAQREPRPSGSGQTRKLRVVIALFLIAAAHAQTIDEKKLDHAIDQVVHQREFTWRAPRATAGPEGKWVGWYRSAVKMVGDLWDLVWQKLRAWLRPDERQGGNGQDAAVNRKAMLALITMIIALIAAGLIVFVLRRKRSLVVAAQAVTALPAVNLADESLSADRLPESEWLKLADEWMEKGDFRMALRAMYLASLNYLSGRDLVSLRRWKSGLDYRRELARRARSKPALPAAFSRSVEIFEQGWYGRHAVDRAMAEDFAKGLQEMRAHAK